MPTMPSLRAAVAVLLLSAAFAAHALTPLPRYLYMRWELLDAQQGRSRAQFVIRAAQPLPAQGWSIYFNCMDGIVTGPLDGGLLLEQAGGGLYRLRPGPDFKGIKDGHTIRVVYNYPNRVFKMSRAPTGPYLVLDKQPGFPIRIDDFTAAPLPADALPDGDARHRRMTVQDTYRLNAQADLLPPSAVPPIFPTPLRLTMGQGSLRLRQAPRVIAAAGLENEERMAKALVDRHALLAPLTEPLPQSTLRLSVGEIKGQASPEAYTMTVDDDGIAIVGNSAAGVSRGLQSLRDLLPSKRERYGISVPELTVTDAPRFGYRGFQLDVARNFHDKGTVLWVLDQMAAYKLNTLHLHLTDDEGWRLEIPGLPELTGIGARRGHSDQPGRMLPPAYGSGPYNSDPHGSGYYTRADYIDILRYAAARHIEVIPEIEMPGHARAAVKAMEARYLRMQAAGEQGAVQFLLHDPDDRSVYRSPQEYTDHVINPGRESSYAFIEQVVAQIADMHREAGTPLRTLHVGGDELPNGAWERSPMARALMQREKLSTMADLWDYFYDRVDGILRRHGLFASGWEELGARREGAAQAPNPRFARRGFSLYVWNNTEGEEDFAYRLANAGYDTVLAPVTKLYLDMAVNANPDEPGVNWGAYVDLQTVYDFVPLDYLRGVAGKERLTASGRGHIRGLEATLFTETVRDPLRLQYLLMPRLMAAAERAWAADPAWANEADPARASALHRAAWSGFVNVLGQRVLPRLDDEGVDGYRIAPPGMTVEDGRVLVNHELPGMVLRYTSDGTAPDWRSRVVDGAIADKGVIQAAAFARNGRRGPVSRIDNP